MSEEKGTSSSTALHIDYFSYTLFSCSMYSVRKKMILLSANCVEQKRKVDFPFVNICLMIARHKFVTQTWAKNNANRPRRPAMAFAFS